MFKMPASGTACRYRCALLVMFVGCIAASTAHAQLNVNLSVDFTEMDGLFRYDYTLENLLTSSLGVNGFLLTVGAGDHVIDMEGPENWTSFYEPTERDLQVAWLANEDAFEILPGQQAAFSLSSPYAPDLTPELKEPFIARFTSDFSDVLGVADPIEILVPWIPPPSDPCDFNMSGACDLADIDLLGTAIADGNNDPAFDLTGDGNVDSGDLDDFLATVNKLNGDVNFSGGVDFPDFLTLSANFGKADAVWSEGDFAPDKNVGFPDFLILSANFGQSTQALAASVPEPSGLALAAFAGFIFAALRTRGRSVTT